MSAYLEIFFADAGRQAVVLAACAALWLGFAMLGALVAGRRRLPEADAVGGWALAVVAFTFIGTASSLAFTWLAWAVFAAMAAAAAMVMRREDRILPSGLGRAWLLMVPLLLIASAMAPSQWDEFSHWLPSARFLVVADGFPSAAEADTGASFPSYPYGWPLVTYLASTLGGSFLTAAGAVSNLFLLSFFGLAATRLVMAAQGEERAQNRGWGWAALAVLLVTLFNTTFVQKVILTAYADTATAVAVGMAVVLGWFLLQALAEDRAAEARAYAWQVGLVLTVLVSLKQATLVLAVLVLGALVLTALLDRRVAVLEFAKLLAWMALLPAAVYLAWRGYVGNELPGMEFAIRPVEAWHTGLIGEIALAMLTVLAKKGAYLALMLAAVVVAVAGLRRRSGGLWRIAMPVALLFVGYNAFLFFSYVAAFGEFEARRAASLWRYNMHLGLAGVCFLAYGAALVWHRRAGVRVRRWPLGGVAVAVVVLAPLVLAQKLSFDDEDAKPHYRQVAQSLPALLPRGSRFVVIDPKGTGESGKFAEYHTWRSADFAGYLSAFQESDPAAAMRFLKARTPDAVLVHSHTPAVERALGIDLEDNTSTLLLRKAEGDTAEGDTAEGDKAEGGAGWRVETMWPHPPALR